MSIDYLDFSSLENAKNYVIELCRKYPHPFLTRGVMQVTVNGTIYYAYIDTRHPPADVRLDQVYDTWSM